MNEPVLTSERILEAAEDVLRRFGPAKATVVDVARALGVSHGTVYRHFPSKTALRDAVTARWLGRISAPLAIIAAEEGSAQDRLRRWFSVFIAMKRRKALDDPELFATYHEIAEDAREVVREHIETLVRQVAHIIADGRASGEFAVVDPESMARAIFDATVRFHNPAHATEWVDPHIDAAFEGVWSLILGGLGVTHPEVIRPSILREPS